MSDSKDFVIKKGILKEYKGTGGDVVVPEGVTAIDSMAFYLRESLHSISLPKGVTNIGEMAFQYCSNLQSITIPEGMTSIGSSAFAGCENLTSIRFPEGMTSIGSSAFAGCENLISITFPESLTHIGSWAFAYCKSLTSVEFPKELTSVESGAFKGCKGLTNEAGFVILRGVLYDYTGFGGDITVPAEVSSISGSAFSNCRYLQSISLPESVTSIGNSAFERCSSLRSITLPKGVTSIRDYAFERCTSLRSITLPESVTSIGDYAFTECGSLQRIDLPKSLTRIGRGAFRDCENIRCFVLTDGQRALLTSQTVPNLSMAVLVRGEDSMRFLTFVSKQSEDNLSEFGKPKKWKNYDQEIINNGPKYKYKLPARLLGALGRLQDPVELTEKNRALFAELLNKNAKKLVPLAEELQCPDIIRALFNIGVMDEKTEKAVRKLLAASSIPELSALALTEIKTEVKPKEDKKKAKQKKETEKKAASPLEQEYAAKLNAMDGEKRIKKMKLMGTSFPVTRLKDGTEAPEALFKFLLVSYGSQIEAGDYRFDPEADEAASLLAYDSLCEAMETISGSLDGPSYPAVIPLLCRYGNPKQIQTLCDQWKNWWNWDQYHQKGRKAHEIFGNALILSDTRQALVFLEKAGDLERYATLRGVTVDEVYEKVLFDFGFDESGKRIFDLGVTTIEATLSPELKLSLWNTATGKAVKMIPKKGVDPAVLKKAADELSDMRASLKKAIKIKNDQLFADFIEGKEAPADRWQNNYLRNPFLRGIASLLVWSQGQDTFILDETGAIDSAGQPYAITDVPIRVAHPMEMKAADVEAWQKYFTTHGLKQPFSQVWEPVYQSSDVREDRYDQSKIRLMYLRHQEKRGIELEWWGDNWYYGDRKLEIKGFDVRYEESEDEDDKGPHLIITSLRPRQWNRRANTVIAFLDRITVRGRIRKDDVTVMDQIAAFTLAQITEFIAIAQESGAVNVLALLLEYKKDHFAGFDPMEEFTLEW